MSADFVGNNGTAPASDTANLAAAASSSARRPQIPGLRELLDDAVDSTTANSSGSNEARPSGLYLLSGTAGAGKTMYCRQFIIDGLINGDFCIFISSSLAEDEFKNLLAAKTTATAALSDSDGSSGGGHHPIGELETLQNRQPYFMNPCQFSSSKKDAGAKISSTLAAIRNMIDKAKKASSSLSNDSSNKKKNNKRNRRSGRGEAADDEGRSDKKSAEIGVRIAVDSLTHFSLMCGEKSMTKFILGLSNLVKETRATAICTLAPSEERVFSALGSLADGIIEMRIKENETGNGSLDRSMRLLSIKGRHHKPRWINFRISDIGELIFTNSLSSSAASSSLTCTLCGKGIIGNPMMHLDLAFDTKSCMETYKRLEDAYGPSISQTGLPSEAFTASFFFIDIVGLSNPILSTHKQIEKIQALNKLISSCSAIKKTSDDKKIILPTGDGMAIGFLLHPQLPLELSIELHKKIREYNRNKPVEDQLGVRIGLGSGSVFTVTDMNNVQNVWGPGIILARRVMDAGDNGHILVADKLAEELIALKEEYRSMLRPICAVFEIKHGQKITLYSAYSHDFGNPDLPARVPRIQKPAAD